MRRLTLFLAFIFAFTLVKAQSNKEEIELIQSVFGMEKKAIIAEFIKVDAAQKDAFWALYDEYETKRKDLGKNRITLLEEYAENYDKLTNEKAESWTKQVISQSAKTDDLLVSYVKKISKATNPIVALQFYQVEGYILSGIRLSILEELPLPDVK
jgi:F0F1-type ATP synthase delta subunit